MTVPSTADAFPPHVLREYALIADGERGALVGPRGDIVWMCAPRWHSDAVFAALIGGGGAYAVTPEDRFVWGGYYEPGALIWRSRWITCDAIVECREALAFPGDAHRVVVLRHVMAREGTAKVNVVLDPRAGFTGRGCSPSTRTTSATGTHGSAPCTCAGPATWAAPAPGRRAPEAD